MKKAGTTTTSPVSRQRFWDTFISGIHDAGIQPPADRWHVVRAENYLKTYSEHKLKEHSPSDISKYLADLLETGRLQDWQFRQVVLSLKTLFELVAPPWLDAYDWQKWSLQADKLSQSTPVRDPPASNYSQRESPDRSAVRRACQRYETEIGRAITEIRRRDYSLRTEQSYHYWIRRFLGFCSVGIEGEPDNQEIRVFLEYLAVQRDVSTSTQNQALNALLFFFRHGLEREEKDLGNFTRAKRPKRLPVVLTTEETKSLLGKMTNRSHLMASLMYGTGMRLMECIRLRVKVIDFGYRQIVVRDGKGKKDRVVPLPQKIVSPLKQHLASVSTIPKDDLAQGYGEVALPHAPGRKYPNAGRKWAWQYVFLRPKSLSISAAALLCHPPARSRLRYPYGAGVAGA